MLVSPPSTPPTPQKPPGTNACSSGSGGLPKSPTPTGATSTYDSASSLPLSSAAASELRAGASVVVAKPYSPTSSRVSVPNGTSSIMGKMPSSDAATSCAATAEQPSRAHISR